MAWWQSGYAEDCKSFYAGSIPTQASNFFRKQPLRAFFLFCIICVMITSLSLTDFRNHKTSRINTCGAQNIIITGPNGSGKTAILEAISILSGERGMRGASMSDMARFNGNGGFSVFANLSDETEISVSFNNGDLNRRAKIDGDNAPLSDLSKHLRVVWLTPKEDRLFVDGTSDRRSFFDRLVSGFDSAHSGRVARLSKLLTERAVALKNGADSNWLNALDVQIAGTSVAISVARIQYAGQLNYFLSRCAVSVSGLTEKMLIDGMSAGDAERAYLSYLKDNRVLYGDKMILDGPHKSDFGVFNNELNLPAYLTSTGQQKTVLINLILAHAHLVYTKTAGRILVLLDEAAAHLDSDARLNMFLSLGKSQAQVWATGLEPDVFSDVPNATFVACYNGEINNILQAEKKICQE